jgi:hypothetical protein
MAGGMQDLQYNPSQGYLFSILDLLDWKGRLGRFMKTDACSAGKMVGLGMSLKYVSDLHLVIRGVLKIRLGLQLCIDHSTYPLSGAAYKVRQAAALFMAELLKNHQNFNSTTIGMLGGNFRLKAVHFG